MQNQLFCQSCCMPLDKPELFGTESNGTASKDYCHYCYQNGAFTNPEMTLDEMKSFLKDLMEKMKMDEGLINMTISSLPKLKRWNSFAMSH